MCMSVHLYAWSGDMVGDGMFVYGWLQAEKAMGGKPMIVTGDLNVAHRNIDIYNYFSPHVKKTPGCTMVGDGVCLHGWLQAE